MPKIKQCHSCQFYDRSNYLVCTIHAQGVKTDTCIDYRFDADYIFNQQGVSI